MQKQTNKKSPKKNHPFVLAILDGFGLASEKNPGNAITVKTALHLFAAMQKLPNTRLTAHGEAVGLFPGQSGNSEAGHLNIGAGRIVEQDLVRISRAIRDGRFFKNPAFAQALYHAKKYNAAAHILCLLTDEQSAHARPEHLEALIAYMRRNRQRKVYLHLFTDGRDAPQHAAVEYLARLRECCRADVQVASVMGRFYAMDRNKMWERTKAAYDAIVHGRGVYTARTAEEAINKAYGRSETDEYIAPTVIVTKDGTPVGTVRDHDAIFFGNARSDRARQLTKAFVQHNFHEDNPGAFHRGARPKNTRFVAMTDFGPDLPDILTAFPSPDIAGCLAAAVGDNRKQLVIAESEKFAHVTYFLNGGFPKAINGEHREMVPSTHARSHAKFPGMRARELTTRILAYIRKGTYDFVVVNYANADMVGHTGDFSAAKKAVQILDREVYRLTQGVLRCGGIAVVTADHGTAEAMIDSKTNAVSGEHTTNPVPFIVYGRKDIRLRKKGILADVTPTVLALLHEKPSSLMTGRSLLQ